MGKRREGTSWHVWCLPYERCSPAAISGGTGSLKIETRCVSGGSTSLVGVLVRNVHVCPQAASFSSCATSCSPSLKAPRGILYCSVLLSVYMYMYVWRVLCYL